MASWRESSDPRCPECGGKISASAAYCMHCSTEFDDGGDAAGEDHTTDEGTEYATDDTGTDVSCGDDVQYGADAEGAAGDGGPGTADGTGAGGGGSHPLSGVDVGGLVESLFGIGGDDSGASGSGSGGTADPTAGGETETSVGGDSSEHPDVGVDADESTPTDEADIEKTTLLLRGPVALIMSFPAGILFTLGTVAGFEDLSLPSVAYAAVFFLAWIGVTAYLLTKPLASDAIGDAFYVYAVVLLLVPPVWIFGTLLELLLGGGVAVGETMITAVVAEFFLLFPAALLLLVGYGANYYARRKIESALGEGAAA